MASPYDCWVWGDNIIIIFRQERQKCSRLFVCVGIKSLIIARKRQPGCAKCAAVTLAFKLRLKEEILFAMNERKSLNRMHQLEAKDESNQKSSNKCANTGQTVKCSSNITDKTRESTSERWWWWHPPKILGIGTWRHRSFSQMLATFD